MAENSRCSLNCIADNVSRRQAVFSIHVTDTLHSARKMPRLLPKKASGCVAVGPPRSELLEIAVILAYATLGFL